MLLELMEMYSSIKSGLGFNINRRFVLVFHPMPIENLKFIFSCFLFDKKENLDSVCNEYWENAFQQNRFYKMYYA